ncbi:MAG: AMP-binding protein, partial [bacterium]|nr:AMP-binding protein [bacterium]
MNHDNIDWELSQLDIHTSSSKFDLAMELDERGGEIIGRVEYNTGLFDAQTIKRLVDHYIVLLASIVEKPSAQISALSLLSDSEKKQLLFQWNDNKVNYQGGKLLHGMVEKQVDLTPHATAVIFEDTQITYLELEERANQLANHLLQLGSKPEDLIVVWTDRSIDHIVAIFAVLKSGAAYVPISSEDPAERAAFIMEDTNARIVICDSSHHQLLAPKGIHIVDLDTERELIRRNTTERPRVDVLPENLAYVIYTSGSTGKPKGVMIEHRSIADRSHWAAASLRLREGDVSLHLFSLAFDASVVPGWWSLNQGAAVLIPSNKGMQNPDYLGQVIENCGVTTICATPSIMNVVVREIEKREYSGIRNLMTGGES